MRSNLNVAAIALTSLCFIAHAQSAATKPATAKPTATATTSTPASPAKQAKIEEMLKITRVEPSLQQMTQQMQGRIKQLAQQQTASAGKAPDQQKLTSDYLAKMQSISDTNVTWDHIKPGIIQSYSDSFTDAQLDSILAFYHTPAGQALVEKTPDLSSKTMESVQHMVAEVQPEMQQATKDYTDKLKATTPPSISAPLADPPAGGTKPSSSTPPPSSSSTPQK